MKQHKTWLQKRMDSPAFLKALSREAFIEEFLGRIEEEMQRAGVSRVELAGRMGCRPSNVTRILKRSTNLTAETMVDLAAALGLRLYPLFKPASHAQARGCDVIRFPVTEHWTDWNADWGTCIQEEASHVS